MPRQIRLTPYIVVATLATIFGMIYMYWIIPPIFVGVNPNHLNEAAQQQWIMNVAIASSSDPLIKYDDAATIELVSRVPNPRETIASMLNSPNISQSDALALNELLAKLPSTITGTPMAQMPIFSQVMQLLIPIVIVVAAGLIIGKIFIFITGRNASQ